MSIDVKRMDQTTVRPATEAPPEQQMDGCEAAGVVLGATAIKTVGIMSYACFPSILSTVWAGGAFYGGHVLTAKDAIGDDKKQIRRAELIEIVGNGVTTLGATAIVMTVGVKVTLCVAVGGALITTIAAAPKARGALYRAFCCLTKKA